MNVKYCSSCGSKTEYLLEIPKFCTKCGKPMNAAFAKKAAGPIGKIRGHKVTHVIDDEIEDDHINEDRREDATEEFKRIMQGSVVTVVDVPKFKMSITDLENYDAKHARTEGDKPDPQPST